MLDSISTLDHESAPCVDGRRPCETSQAHESDRDTGNADAAVDPDARRLAHEIVARFVRDPATFAATVRAEAPSTFLRDYRQGLDRRLTALVGAPKTSADRLATLGAPVIDAPADWLPRTRDDKGVEQPDLSPRMGPVVVAAALVTAVCAVVTAACAVVTAASALSRHVQK